MNPGSEWPRYSAATRNQASSVDPRVQQRSRDSSCWSPSQRCSRSTWRYSACKRRVWAASPRRMPIRSAIPRDTDRAVRSEIDWPCQGVPEVVCRRRTARPGLVKICPQSAVGSPSGRSPGCHTPAIPHPGDLPARHAQVLDLWCTENGPPMTTRRPPDWTAVAARDFKFGSYQNHPVVAAAAGVSLRVRRMSRYRPDGSFRETARMTFER